MRPFSTQVDVHSQAYQDNRTHHLKLLETLKSHLEKVKEGGGPLAVERHRKRDKLLPRERIETLLDKGSAFLELSPLAAHECYEREGGAPSGGLVTGIGPVHGIPCMFVANDATVKGGAYFPLTVKKHLRAQEIAFENNLPCLYLVDSGGAFLPKQDSVFPDKDHFGRIFYNQAQMSSKGIPQIAVVCGPCTAGGAYIPAMADESIIVKGNGTIFLGGPPLVKAATGESVSAQDIGGGELHARLSGVVDHLAEHELEALTMARDLVKYLHHSPSVSNSPRPPQYAPEEIYGILPKDFRHPYDVREIIARLVDASEFFEFKKEYGQTLVCAFAFLHGHKVGLMANNGVLFSESARKGAHFVELCGQRKIPLIFLQNVTGFMVGKDYETKGIAKHGARLVTAVSTVNVPKFTVVIGGSFGAGNYGMCGRAYQPRFLWMWPNARISVMGGEQAAGVLTTVRQEALKAQGKKSMTKKEELEFQKPILEKYARESSAYYSTARLWYDGIIDPSQTRDILGLALNVALQGEISDPKFAFFRM